MQGSISLLHVILLSMTVIGLKNHVTILPPLLTHVGRNAWASVFVAAFGIFLWIFLLIHIQKKTDQQNLFIWLEETSGPIISKVFSVTLGVILLIIAAFTMREVLQWINATFLPDTPVILLLLVYTSLCVLLACTDIQTIVITNVLVLFGVIIFGIFVAIVNIQVKDYYLLLPFFEDGYKPALKGSIYPASGFIEFLLFILIQHKIRGRIRISHYFIMISILSILTLGPLVGAIVEFGPTEAAKQRFPAYEEWGLATIGRYLENVDFLSIYQWLTGAFIRIGFLLYIVVTLFNLEGQAKKIWIRVTPPFLIVCLFLLNINDQFFSQLKGEYVLVSSFIILLITSLFLFMITFKSTRGTSR